MFDEDVLLRENALIAVDAYAPIAGDELMDRLEPRFSSASVEIRAWAALGAAQVGGSRAESLLNALAERAADVPPEYRTLFRDIVSTQATLGRELYDKRNASKSYPLQSVEALPAAYAGD